MKVMYLGKQRMQPAKINLWRVNLKGIRFRGVKLQRQQEKFRNNKFSKQN